MVKNLKQVNKIIEHVNKDLKMTELVKVMDEFEQVRLLFLTSSVIDCISFCVLGIRNFRC